VVVPLPGFLLSGPVGGSGEAPMAFREVGMHEIREVLRLRVRLRACGRSSGCRGWTVRRSAGM
jgi:hypothetical protein